MRTFVRLAVVAAFLCLAPVAWSEPTDSGSAPSGEPAASLGAKSLANGIFMGGTFLATYGAGYSSVTVNLDDIYNTSAFTTGTLRLSYWATTSHPVRGQGFTGYRLATFSTFSPLLSGYYYYNIVRSSSMLLPPYGTYWLILALEEYSPAFCSDPSGFCIQDSFISDTQRTFGILPATYTLNVSVSGPGSGVVSSTPAGITCPGDCSENYGANTLVALNATPTAGSVFAGWSGACSGTGACTVTMSNSIFVTATFTTNFALTVSRPGTGGGAVISIPAGINCGIDCSENYPSGTTVTLTETPAYGSLFSGWSGACAGMGSCIVSMTQARAVAATFTLDPADSDGDGIPNGVEVREGRNPLVKDNDVFSPGAGAARLFAMQQYRDYLGREGDAAGIQGWTDAISSGAMTRAQAVDGFLTSPEFAGFVAPVVRLYFATFLRVPDYAGLTFNAGLVKNGTVTLTQLADFFTQSPEFATTYGSLDNAQFVTLLYNNVLGRAPDTAGLNGWVSLLGSSYTRGQVLLGFSDSAEYQAAMANEVFVTMMYTGMLRRTPEAGGFNAWVSGMDAGTYSRTQVINGFFLSTEYHNRFLP
jgi:Domain of unknown function (DUF4214)/Divergent InlB B-repeat domain